MKGAIGLLACALCFAFVAPAAVAADRVPAETASRPDLEIDVWMNKEEGGVYRSGERMRIYFRTSTDAYVLIYNIDTEGFVHLIYPYGPSDPPLVEGGRSIRVPARHDPYELAADGPPGVEYVVAVASPAPFRDLPWYLDGREETSEADEGEDDALRDGAIAGDPYVGMDRITRRVVRPEYEDEVATADTYFYIGRRVEYPRYVCSDCHYRPIWFDPYVDPCTVIDIRIDATWARYRPLRVRSVRPRYYYWIRSSAPDQYRTTKERWSTIDGRKALRSKFQLEQERQRQRQERVIKKRPQPKEFKDIRRYRPGRLWMGREEILKLREQRKKEQVNERRKKGEPPADKEARPGRSEGDARRDRATEARERRRQAPEERRKADEKPRQETREKRRNQAEDRDTARERKDEKTQERGDRRDRQELRRDDRSRERAPSRERSDRSTRRGSTS